MGKSTASAQTQVTSMHTNSIVTIQKVDLKICCVYTQNYEFKQENNL